MHAKVIHARPEEEYWFREGCHILEVANHPGDPQVSIARARLEPGMTTQWHSLRDTWERYLIVEGTGIAEIGDLEPARVAAGDVVLIPPDTPQRIRNAGSGELIFYAICSPRFMPACYRAHEP
jgi:mannose-6-phosphate isomerase-like protein (cupin superfamily)